MTIKIGDDELKPNERRFVEEYLIDFKQREAAIRAGYSPASAHVTASRLMKAPAVEKALAEASKKMLDRFNITQERVLAEYARLAFSDLGDAIEIDDEGTATINLAKIKDSKDFRAAVAEINQSDIKLGKDGEGGVERRTRIKLHDKKGALDALAKYLRLMPDQRVEVTGADGGPIKTETRMDLSALSVEELLTLNSLVAKAAAKKAD
jgi:phage terminase small subunit